MKTLFKDSYFWGQTFLRVTKTSSQEICIYLCTLKQKHKPVYPKMFIYNFSQTLGSHLWTFFFQNTFSTKSKGLIRHNKFFFKILSASILINLKFGTLCAILHEYHIEMKRSYSTSIIVIITSWRNLPRIIKSYLQLHCLFIGH